MADKPFASVFPSIQDAIIAGLRACKEAVPENLECGVGVFKRPDGSFGHTVPASGENGSIDNMPLRYPKTSTVVAFGHTHPTDERISHADDTSDGFSPNDAKFAKRNKEWEMYLGSQKSGRITKLAPGSKKTTNGIVYGADVDALYEPTRREALEAAYDLHNPEGKK
jgi:hypothetical protein